MRKKQERDDVNAMAEDPIYQCATCGAKIQGEHLIMLRQGILIASIAIPQTIAHLCNERCLREYRAIDTKSIA
jgi:hypothetical protein